MNYFVNLLLLFFIYSFVGWCIEVTLKFFQYHRFINRGFLNGPCLPIYGGGCVLVTAAIDGLTLILGFEYSIISVFAVSFILCGTLEYLVSLILEKRFHARWWDYSNKPMNLNGRVWIGNLLLFGAGGAIVVKLVNPLLYKLFALVSLPVRGYISIGLSVLIIADYLVSHFVLKLVKDSVEKSEADNTEAISKEVKKMMNDKNLFAKRFANAYPDVIYRTEKVKARRAAVKAQAERFRKEAEQFLSDALEPTTQIRNNVIRSQDKLIAKLYSESSADAESKKLKKEIDSEMERLKNRNAI